MASLTAALLVAALLGVWFATTRWLAICSFALLCALHPWLAILVVIGVAWAFYFFKIRKR